MRRILRKIRQLTRKGMTRLRWFYWKLFLQDLGKGTRFYGPVVIGRPEEVSIGAHSTLNHGVIINAREPVVIGDHVRIAPRAIINADGLDYKAPRESREHISKPVTIKNGAWIGAGAIINPGVTIGEDAAVAAGAVVLQDVPARTLVFGSPARIMQDLSK